VVGLLTVMHAVRLCQACVDIQVISRNGGARKWAGAGDDVQSVMHVHSGERYFGLESDDCGIVVLKPWC
jgi:hypothetical protein